MRCLLFTASLTLGAALSLWPARGAAFCRTTTVDAVATGCPATCETAGLPLYWPMRQISYAVSERGFPGLDEATVRDIFERSFGAWSDVDCDGQFVGLDIVQESATTDLGPRPKDDHPSINVLEHLDSDEWQDDPHAFAITNLRFGKGDGHILGADMFFNGGMDPFGVCPDDGGCVDDSVADLANVVTHEAGHFLGLAHSAVPGSTMWCDAKPGDVDKRSLEQDDEDGLCAIYGPSAVAAPISSHARPSGGVLCSAWLDGHPRAGGGWLLSAIVGAMVYRRRR